MNLQEIVLSSSSLQLSHSLNEGCTLNISHCASKLNNADIRCLIGIVDWDASHAFDPVLNRVGQMRYYLDSLSEIVAATLALNDVLVDLASGDVVLASEGNIEVSLVVSEVEVDFSTVIEDKDFTVSDVVSRRLGQTAISQTPIRIPRPEHEKEHSLRRGHSPSIDIHIRVNFNGRDVVSSAQCPSPK